MAEAKKHGASGVLKHAIRRCNVVITMGLYFAVAPFGYLIFAGLCWLWRGDAVRRAKRLQGVTARAYRFMHAWLSAMRITRFDPRAQALALPQGPCVVVANHPTLMDITSITAVLGGGSTVVKPALWHRRMLHPLLVGAGHVEGPGSDPISIGRVVDDMVERLRAGMNVIVFPEGTRSLPGQLHRFGRLAFEIACRADVPMVSLVVTCVPVYVSKEVTLFRPPHPTPVLRLGLLATDAPKDVGHDSKALRERVESRYRDWLAELA
ncbi:MAG: lysophospholipid acyltransferase family protein [Planctomycetota bacterium]